MHAFLFPGQGAQFPGMGKDLYEASVQAKKMFHQANEILGFSITDIMFGEDAEALKQTQVTQPAIFLHSVILSTVMGTKFQPDAVAGHSLGEFSALVAAKALTFEDGLKLVHQRALALAWPQTLSFREVLRALFSSWHAPHRRFVHQLWDQVC